MPGTKRKKDSAASDEPNHDGNAHADTPSAAKKPKQQDVAAAKTAKEVAKATPVLQWMRVPVALEGTSALALRHVKGIDHRLVAALERGTL